MQSALKAAAVVVCCAGWAFADPVTTDQTPPTVDTSTVHPAKTANHDDAPPQHDGIHRDGLRDGDGHNGRDGRDGRRGWPGAVRGGPFARMRGQFHPGVFRMNENRPNATDEAHGMTLGIAVSEPEPELSSQLNLPDGIGLVVEQVMPNTSASSAGLEKYDVVQKLDDQLVVNVEQVGVLIRMHKPGDTVMLTIIRHGKSQELTATLGDQNSHGQERSRPAPRPMRHERDEPRAPNRDGRGRPKLQEDSHPHAGVNSISAATQPAASAAGFLGNLVDEIVSGFQD